MAIHCRILAWEIPWTEEPGGLWSLVSQRVGHDWTHTDTHTHRHTHRHTGSFRSFMQDLVSWPEIEPRPCFLFFSNPSSNCLRWQSVCLQCWRLGFDPWVGKILWRRKWQPTPVFLPGNFHGQRSLVGYNPWGHKESDTTEWLHFHFQLYYCCLIY